MAFALTFSRTKRSARQESAEFGAVAERLRRAGDLQGAVALCRDNNSPIVVFNIRQPGNLAEVLAGRGIATIVQNEE